MLEKLFLIRSVNANLVLSGPDAVISREPSLDLSVFKLFFQYASAILFVIGIIFLLDSLVFYLIAAGEEPKMAKAFHALKLGIIFLILTVFLWGVGMVI